MIDNLLIGIISDHICIYAKIQIKMSKVEQDKRFYKILRLHPKNVSSHKIAGHSFGQAFLITLLLLVSKDFKMKMGFGSHEGSFFLKE